MTKYWIGITSQKNLELNRRIRFPVAGFSNRLRKRVRQVQPGDKILTYVEGRYRFAAICEATSKFYYDDKNKIWPEDNDTWPCRFKTRPILVLADNELLDVKKLVPQLTFITPRQKATKWGLAFQQGLIEIPEDDFGLVESEMRKLQTAPQPPEVSLTEEEAEKAIMALPLEKASLHDRIGEMLETIGSRMGYNAYTGHRVTPDHAVKLDVAWLQGKNPEVAIEVQIGGSIIEAKDKLAQARKFNYRKIIMVIEESHLTRLNAIARFDELINWMDAWSIPAVYKLYCAGMSFLGLYERLRESRYKKRTEVEFIRE
jgi:hypothetical protein